MFAAIQRPNLGFKMKSPISSIKERYEASVSANGFKAHFADRNNQSVVKPFLDGLGAEYILVYQLLIVKESDSLKLRLGELGFNMDTEIATVTSSGFKSEHLHNITNRFYHKEYNIELFVQPSDCWNIVTTADAITTNLKFDPTKQTVTFLSVYDSLHTLLKKSKG